MARKKIVFVIVEGPSDEEALGVIFNRIYDNQTVYVQIMHRDITSDREVTTTNIISKLCNEIRGYAASNHFKKDDFKEIIHIVDMDGAFIPDSNVVEDASAADPVYSLTQISTCNKKGIEQRNHHKDQNLSKLCTSNEIWNIPYGIFYMSSNLDHVLYDKLNSSNHEKQINSYNFAKKYMNNISEFLTFISDSDFSVTGDYHVSWDYIRQDLHSLERHTNLGLCFQKDKK